MKSENFGVAEEVLAMGYFMWNWKNNKVCLLGGV
jgi:hypothetical protein